MPKNKKPTLFDSGLVQINNKKNKSAILFLHGFTAKPEIFKTFFKISKKDKVLKKFDFYAPMQVHNIENKVFKENYKDWLFFTNLYYKDLDSRYKNVIIVGHSLGGSIALNYAYSNNLKNLILLSVPLKIDFRLLFGKHKNSKIKNKIRNFCIYYKVILNIFKLINKNKKIINKLEGKLLYFLGKKDQIISQNNLKFLKRRSKSLSDLKIVSLKKAKHESIVRYKKFARKLKDRISNYLK